MMTDAQAATPGIYRLFDADPTPVAITGEQWVVRYVNEATVNLLEVSAEDLIGVHLDRLSPLIDSPELFVQAQETLGKCDEVFYQQCWLSYIGGLDVDIRIQRLAAFLPGDKNLLWRFLDRAVYRAPLPPLSEAAQMYRTLVEVASDGVCIVQDENICVARVHRMGILGNTRPKTLVRLKRPKQTTKPRRRKKPWIPIPRPRPKQHRSGNAHS